MGSFFYFSVSPARKDFFRKPTFNSLFDPFGSPCRGQKPSLPLRKAPPLISVFSPQGRRGKPPYSADFSTSPSLLQGELHFLPKPLFLRKRGCNRPTRCSEPLRSKVGGPSKVFAMLCGMGPPYYSSLIRTALLQLADWGGMATICYSLMIGGAWGTNC